MRARTRLAWQTLLAELEPLFRRSPAATPTANLEHDANIVMFQVRAHSMRAWIACACVCVRARAFV